MGLDLEMMILIPDKLIAWLHDGPLSKFYLFIHLFSIYLSLTNLFRLQLE